MAQPRAVIHIVGAEPGAHQLLEQIGFLVRSLGRTEPGEPLAALFVADFGEPGAGALQRFLPGRFPEMG